MTTAPMNLFVEAGFICRRMNDKDNGPGIPLFELTRTCGEEAEYEAAKRQINDALAAAWNRRAAPPPVPAAPSAAQPDALPLGYIPIPQSLSPDTARMVCAFAAALAARLALSENKPRRGSYWQRTDWRDELVMQLQRHVHKGDPLDVAAYCAFAWHHGWDIAPAQPSQGGSVSERAAFHLAAAEVLDKFGEIIGVAQVECIWRFLSAARASAPAAPEVVEALQPFAAVAEHDIGDDEADADQYRPMANGNNRAPLITVGDLHRALRALRAAGEAANG